MIYELEITKYELGITNYELGITKYELGITKYELGITTLIFTWNNMCIYLPTPSGSGLCLERLQPFVLNAHRLLFIFKIFNLQSV